MKLIKLFTVVALSAMTVAASAAPTATALITVKSASGNGTDKIILMEAADGTAAYVDGQDVHKLMNTTPADYCINMYAVNGADEMSTYYSNTLTDLALVFKSNKVEADYTMTFSSVTGTVKLYDAVANKTVTLKNGDSYPFTQAANTTVDDRFIINSTYVAPEFCFNYDKLTVKGYNGKSIKITSKEGSLIDQKTAIGDSYEYDFIANGKPAGRYIVEFDLDGNGTAEEYQIDVKPAVH